MGFNSGFKALINLTQAKYSTEQLNALNSGLNYAI